MFHQLKITFTPLSDLAKCDFRRQIQIGNREQF